MGFWYESQMEIGRLNYRREDNTKMVFREIGWSDMN
jgi:hypothetical protein